MGLGPFDWTGGPFLALYTGLLVMAGLLSLMIPVWIRPEGRPGRISDNDDLAFLAGGSKRMIEAALARLYANGALIMDDKGRFSGRGGARGDTGLDRAILGFAMQRGWASILREASAFGTETDRRLTANGLLIDPGARVGQRLLATLPLIAVMGFGAIKLSIGLSRDKPVGFLVILLVLTGILALVRFATMDLCTVQGREKVREARLASERLRLSPTREEVGLAVALFGTGALVGSPWSSLHAKRYDGGDSSGSGSGDGGCGGGGCGGGCGGCGS